MYVALLLLAAVLSAVIAPPVPASWPMYQYSPSHNAIFKKPKFRVAWVAELGGRINGGLAIVGDTIYADSFDHCLYAVDLPTGAVKWKSCADNVLMSTPVVSGGRVIVGSGHDGFLESDDSAQKWGRSEGDDVLSFDDKTGHQMWRVHTVGADMASPAISGARLVFANGDLHAYALRLSDGAQLWREALPGIDTMASTTIVGRHAFISICHNSPHFRQTRAIDVKTGRTLWANPNGSCDAAPAVSDGVVYVDGNREDVDGPFEMGGRDVVAAIDERTGRTLWEHTSPDAPYTLVASGEHAIAGTIVNGVLYQSIVNHDCVDAFDGRTGRVLWSAKTLAPVKMSPLVTERRVIFGDSAGLLYSVDRRTGGIEGTSSFKDPFSTSPPIAIGDVLLIANGRYIFAIPRDVL